MAAKGDEVHCMTDVGGVQSEGATCVRGLERETTLLSGWVVTLPYTAQADRAQHDVPIGVNSHKCCLSSQSQANSCLRSPEASVRRESDMSEHEDQLNPGPRLCRQRTARAQIAGRVARAHNIKSSLTLMAYKYMMLAPDSKVARIQCTRDKAVRCGPPTPRTMPPAAMLTGLQKGCKKRYEKVLQHDSPMEGTLTEIQQVLSETIEVLMCEICNRIMEKPHMCEV
ncbi:hypothetical protein IMY05_C4825000200 [Salix suchowensis]|nr:hypothetical protein IMY05_C4825000200 [Salix suchowensis]